MYSVNQMVGNKVNKYLKNKIKSLSSNGYKKKWMDESEEDERTQHCGTVKFCM